MFSISVKLMANYWILMCLLVLWTRFFLSVVLVLVHHPMYFYFFGLNYRSPSRRSAGHIEANVTTKWSQLYVPASSQSAIPILNSVDIVWTIHKSELTCHVRLSVQRHNLIFTWNNFFFSWFTFELCVYLVFSILYASLCSANKAHQMLPNGKAQYLSSIVFTLFALLLIVFKHFMLYRH